MDIEKSFNLIASKINSPESEREFRTTCSLYESQCLASNQPLSKDYQKYIELYHRITSLYLIESDKNRTKLTLYDTENDKGEVIILDTPEILDWSTCITQLPNGELFCYGSNYPSTGITLIIDNRNKIRLLPSGTPCCHSSGIYFNGSVYCFGGRDNNDQLLALFNKFDFNENRWVNLISMPVADGPCHSVIFNGNILLSGCANRSLLLYSTELNSFSTIPYNFAGYKRKILINTERLYLIECGGLMYESEDEYNWSKISNSIISSYPSQVYCSYNKGGVYISNSLHPRYYRFDLFQKSMTILQ